MAVPLLPEVIKIGPDVLSREIEGETVLLNLKDGTYYSLDEVGTRVWQLIVEYPEISKVCDCLLAEYEVDGGTLRSDLAELINELTKAGIVITETLPPQV